MRAAAAREAAGDVSHQGADPGARGSGEAAQSGQTAREAATSRADDGEQSGEHEDQRTGFRYRAEQGRPAGGPVVRAAVGKRAHRRDSGARTPRGDGIESVGVRIGCRFLVRDNRREKVDCPPAQYRQRFAREPCGCRGRAFGCPLENTRGTCSLARLAGSNPSHDERAQSRQTSPSAIRGHRKGLRRCTRAQRATPACGCAGSLDSRSCAACEPRARWRRRLGSGLRSLWSGAQDPGARSRRHARAARCKG